jgi:hypothetical protein
MKTMTFLALAAAVATAASMTVSERATGGYLQPASGTATFTSYSGCGAPGAFPPPLRILTLTSARSVRQVCVGLHRRDLAALVRLRAGLGRGRRVRPLLPAHGHVRPVLALVQRPVREEHRRQGHGPLPRRGQLGLLRPDAEPPVQHLLSTSSLRSMCRWVCGAARWQEIHANGLFSGAPTTFFPSGHGALKGTFTEVSCSQWSGSDGGANFNGACLSGESAGFWPSGTGCGNKGELHPSARANATDVSRAGTAPS